jgi:molybdopterin adenylyltransferase
MTDIRVAILTVSDRSYQGQRQDLSGPAIKKYCLEQGWEVGETSIVPDDQKIIKTALKKWLRPHQFDLVLTTGGTGFSPRDVTPEATQAMIERNAPGLAEAMRTASAQKAPFAYLSRATAGICGKTLIINLPGSPAGAVECLAALTPILPHGIELLQGTFKSERHY